MTRETNLQTCDCGHPIGSGHATTCQKNIQESNQNSIEGKEAEPQQIGSLEDFDLDYFHELEGEDGWVALGNEVYKNQRYFTVVNSEGERLGIVGMFDLGEQKNVSHTVVDPKYRGQGFAQKFKEKLLDFLGEDYYISTVSLDNQASMRAMEKIPGVKVLSDKETEKDLNKRTYRVDRAERKGE